MLSLKNTKAARKAKTVSEASAESAVEEVKEVKKVCISGILKPCNQWNLFRRRSY